MEQKEPTFEELTDGRLEVRYETINEATGEVISHTVLRGTLEELVMKLITAHRGAVMLAERNMYRLMRERLQIAEEKGIENGR
jgi:hypothetical protein